MVVVAVAVAENGFGPQRSGKEQVEHRVVGVAVVGSAQNRARHALAQRLAVAETEHPDHPAGVHGLRRSD